MSTSTSIRIDQTLYNQARQDALAEQARHFAQEDGDVVGLAVGDGLADVRANEDGVGAEAVAVLRSGVGRLA